MAKVAINKSLLKEYNGSTNERIVYMEDGDEFQIQFFNPESSVVAVEISLNGKPFSSKLILRPGERVWLERFIDSEQKFKFSTYEVGTSKEIKKAIENNGVIEVKFYKENLQVKNNPIIFINPRYYDYSYARGSADVNTVYYNSSVSTITANGANNAATTAQATMDSWQPSSLSCSYSVSLDEIPCKRKLSKEKTETGRIEQGNHSDQEINYVSGYNFNYWPFAEEKIHIYPKSTKPVFKSDLTKKYCSNCGRKLSPKAKYKFCPYCGEKLN